MSLVQGSLPSLVFDVKLPSGWDLHHEPDFEDYATEIKRLGSLEAVDAKVAELRNAFQVAQRENILHISASVCTCFESVAATFEMDSDTPSADFCKDIIHVFSACLNQKQISVSANDEIYCAKLNECRIHATTGCTVRLSNSFTYSARNTCRD